MLIAMRKTIISLLLITFFIFTNVARSLAEDPTDNKNSITDLKMGQLAPFAGTLISKDVAAKIFADLKTADEKCQIKVDKSTELLKIDLNNQIKILELQITLLKEKDKELFQIKDQRIKFLEENVIATPWYKSGEFLFSMGALIGIGVSVGVSYAISNAVR